MKIQKYKTTRVLRSLTSAIVLLLLFVVYPTMSDAAFVWNWRFLNDNIKVGLDEVVYQRARIYNNSTAGEQLGIGSFDAPYMLSGAGVSSEPHFYSVDFFDILFYSTLPEILLPGEYADFVFATYTPTNNLVPRNFITPDQFLQVSRVSVDGTNIILTRYEVIERCFNWHVSTIGVDRCFDAGLSPVAPSMVKAPVAPRSPIQPNSPAAPKLDALFSPFGPTLPETADISLLAKERIATTTNPEPMTVLLFGGGLLGIGLSRKKRPS